ncbi:MAG: Gfo/Idh/MocA family protein [Adhaeribacter sp.]
MKHNSQINWGIIGCGDVTEVKSGPAFNMVPGSRLAAVMRRDAAKAADYARRHQVPAWYDQAEKLLDDPQVNAVYVATPPSSHLEYALAALQKGLPVYVEKPLALNAHQARHMAQGLAQSKGKLTVAHYRRALPMFLFIRDLLSQDTVGEVRTVQIRMWQSPRPALIAQSETNWRLQPELSGGGYFHDLAPHQLDLMLFYFGEPAQYSGFSLNQSGDHLADDHVCGQILFRNTVVVNGSWCFQVAPGEAADVCEIIGTRGRITFPFFGHTVSWRNETEEQSRTFQHPAHIQQPYIEKTAAYFRGEGPNPCSISEAITLMEIMDAFTQSIDPNLK